MFSFKAYFWNNEVYINEQYKYAANEILTAYLNTDFYKRIDEEDLVYVLKTLKRSLLLTEDMEQANYEDYPSIVSSALAWLDEINEWLMQIPPYDKILEDRIYTLDSLLNGYRFFFDDGREIYEKDDKITWETITPNGCGDQTETGHFYIKLHKFVPKVLDDYQYYDEDMLYDLNEMNQKITEFFDNYISFIKSYVTVFETIMPFVDNYLHRESCFLSDNDIAKIFKEFQQKHIKNFLGIKCKMNSFGYKALKNQNNKPILCEEIRFADLESFLFYDFFNFFLCSLGISNVILIIIAIPFQYVIGYITMQGGHRVGITGNVVMKDDKVININYIYSLNFRIAKQVIGCSNKVLKYATWGLFLFVALPLPGTGAWTGALVAAMFDLRMKYALPSILGGVVVAGFIMSGISYGFLGFLQFLA
jgi:hypothetical protein